MFKNSEIRNYLKIKNLKLKNFAAATIMIAALFVILTFSFSGEPSRAGSSDNVSGWAWSENIGWMSFNCTNTNSCVSVNYGVNIDNATGNFSGYAWSENIGWINFAPTSGFPSPPFYSARIDNATNQVNGWVRAMASADGWDGWIKMSGENYGAARTRSGGGCGLEGYAWGGDVVGWVHFSGANYGVNIAAGRTVTPSFTYDPLSPLEGEPVGFTDTTETSCGASIVGWGWNFQDGNPDFSSFQNPAVVFTGPGSKTVSLTVTDSDGNRWTVVSGSGEIGEGGDSPPNVEVRAQPRFREI